MPFLSIWESLNALMQPLVIYKEINIEIRKDFHKYIEKDKYLIFTISEIFSDNQAVG